MKRNIIQGLIIVVFTTILAGSIIACHTTNKSKAVDKDFHSELLGENVYIFSPEDDVQEVQNVLNQIYEKQETNQFGADRYGIYFLPGTYDENLDVNVGFYTQVAGLGMVPTDTSLPQVNCLARWLGDDPGNHNACCNFWRSVENLEFRNNCVWAVSQATDMRRVQMDKALFLHDDYGWCSGGFLSDSRVVSMIDSGSQQQWLSRNCAWGTWLGANWNMVFVGLEDGCAPQGMWPVKPYTNIEKTDIIREKPFLVYDGENGYGIYVPRVRTQSQGISWEMTEPKWVATKEEIDVESDCILPISEFYVAHPTDTAAQINAQLATGKNLLLTPGIYTLDEPLQVQEANTICLGIGLATLQNKSGNAMLTVTDASGIVVSGILFDAGGGSSNYLMRVEKSQQEKSCPIFLSDLYFRVGGANPNGNIDVDTCLVIDADDVIGDNFWIWRADHGDGVAWNQNVANTGIEVNGDDVDMYGLMVEHFEKYQTVWNGNRGSVYMYQSEIPYDVASQEVWMSHEGRREGYASFYVADNVSEFEAHGLGIYLYNRDRAVTLHCAMEMPDAPGVSVENICTVMLTGYPGMECIINDAGAPVDAGGDREILLYYCNGEYR